MQGCAPEAVDVSSESPETRKLYGLDDKVTEPFGRQCLMACRLVERGVRFVHLFHGGMGQSRHRHLGCPQQPRGEPPPARGRIGPPHRGSPDGSCSTGSAGFDPRPLARRVWAHADLATRSRPGPQPRDDDRLDGGRENFRGAGRRLERRVRLQGPRTAVSVHDLHTTILHLLGMDHKKLTYRFNGRDIRLTDVYGTPHPADRLLRRRFCPVTRKCFWVYADHSGPLQVADHNAILMPFSMAISSTLNRPRRRRARAGKLLLHVELVEILHRAVVKMLDLGHRLVGHVTTELADLKREALRDVGFHEREPFRSAQPAGGSKSIHGTVDALDPARAAVSQDPCAVGGSAGAVKHATTADEAGGPVVSGQVLMAKPRRRPAVERQAFHVGGSGVGVRGVRSLVSQVSGV